MKRHWEEQELAERWLLTHDEFELVRNRTNRNRLGFAAILKFFQLEGPIPDRAPRAAEGRAGVPRPPTRGLS